MKAMATSQAGSVPACRDLVPLSQFSSHRSERESCLNEHASDPPRNVFCHLDRLRQSHPDVCLYFSLPWDEASQVCVCLCV